MKSPDLDILALTGAVTAGADVAQTVRHLLDVLNPPIDYPLLVPVLRVACESIVAYGHTLSVPTPLFVNIEHRVTALFSVLPEQDPRCPAAPLQRRLTPFPAWRLAIDMIHWATPGGAVTDLIRCSCHRRGPAPSPPCLGQPVSL